MDISRRNFLGTGLFGATIASIGKTAEKQPKPFELCGVDDAKKFVFGSDPLRVRKSFYDLTDDEVKNLCRAVGYMRNSIPLELSTSWESYARIHYKHCTAWDADHPQVHWGWHFLPWHRGYIFFLERILANCLSKQGYNGASFAYPYWDWTNNAEMPNTKERIERGLASPLFGYDLTKQNMVKGDNLGFDNLALYDGNRGPTIDKSRMDPNLETQEDSKQHIQECRNYMSHEYINLMLTTPWEQFMGKPGIDQKTGQGLLESGAHNDGHDWVGTRYGCNRNMGTLRYAANDPIFFMHHANLDRIWSLYKNTMPDVNGPWGEQRYVYPDLDGSPVSVSVKEIFLWTQSVSYQAPSIESFKLKSSPRQINSINSVAFNINKSTTAKAGLSVTIEPDESTKAFIRSGWFDAISLLEVETGPISHKGRARIDVYVGKTYVGRIKIMDGDPSTTSPKASHTFTMTLGELGNIIKAVPTSGKFDLNFYTYGLDKDVLIKNVKLIVMK
jgi:hypothetical protein